MKGQEGLLTISNYPTEPYIPTFLLPIPAFDTQKESHPNLEMKPTNHYLYFMPTNLANPRDTNLHVSRRVTYRRLKVEVPVGLVNRLPSLLRLPLIGALLIYFYTENSFIDGLNEPLTWLTQQSYVWESGLTKRIGGGHFHFNVAVGKVISGG